MNRTKVIYPCSPNADEILVVFDNDGVPQNVTVTDAELAAELAATPETIPNPEYEGLAALAFAAAEAQIDG